MDSTVYTCAYSDPYCRKIVRNSIKKGLWLTNRSTTPGLRHHCQPEVSIQSYEDIIPYPEALVQVVFSSAVVNAGKRCVLRQAVSLDRSVASKILQSIVVLMGI